MSKILFDPATNRAFRNSLIGSKINFILSVEQWDKLTGIYTGLSWSEIQFNRASLNNLPETEGIYTFLLGPKQAQLNNVNYLMYVGETKNLRKRFKNYLDKAFKPKSSQYRMYTLIDDYPQNLFFNYIILPGMNQSERRHIEDEFLMSFLPPMNSKYPKHFERIINTVYAK